MKPRFGWIMRAGASLAISASILGLLVFGPFLLPASWFTSLLSDALGYWYSTLCWSHSVFEPIFPSTVSTYSDECHLAMLITDVVVLAAIVFAFLTVSARVLPRLQVVRGPKARNIPARGNAPGS